MKAVIQRVSEASVSIDEIIKGKINQGFMILLGVGQQDNHDDIEWLSNKIIGLRIFSDQEEKMNLSIKDINGDVLLISQFTLQASTKKGNRPSYINAASPDIAIPLYEQMINVLEQKLEKKIQTGIFGANMQVSLTNDGPVTIIIDTKQKE